MNRQEMQEQIKLHQLMESGEHEKRRAKNAKTQEEHEAPSPEETTESSGED